jgi:hypothetical protein
MNPLPSLDLAVEILGVLVKATKGRPISDPSWSPTEREELERLSALVRELLRRTMCSDAYLDRLPARDFDQLNPDGKIRHYCHGDLADGGSFYDARLDAFVLVTPVTTIAHAGDLTRLSFQLRLDRNGDLLGHRFYRPKDAPNVFESHPLMALPERLLRRESIEQGMGYLRIREAFVVERNP